MTSKKQQKQLQQIKEIFGIDEEQQKADHEQYKAYIAENRSKLTQEELAASEAIIKGEENIINYEDDHPVSQFILDTLIANMDEKDITKVLNFVTSETYQKFFDICQEALVKHANNTIDYIDAASGSVDVPKFNLH